MSEEDFKINMVKVLNVGQANRPLMYKNKAIGKIKNIEYDETTGLIFQYFEIEDEKALEEIKEKVENA